ncbi:hypothetical protein, partial [Thiofaba sp. EF100]|uniref:hypothetical protein n=1 Tax=Thiofaba sp. EF100 TaxID=3121274 RepID=UPI003221559D
GSEILEPFTTVRENGVEPKVTNKAKILVLQRLVDAYAAGSPHVNTKKLMKDTGCASPSNLFTSKHSPWRNYLIRVKGSHAWQLNLPTADAAIEDDDLPHSAAEITENA